MLVRQLLITNPQYDAQVNGVSQMRLHEDLYEGGAEFEKRKNLYLRKRQSELAGNGAKLFELRLKSACYTPHMAGIIDNFNACILTVPPRIVATGPEDKVAYYNSLNQNIDGKGRDLPALVQEILLQIMLHWRGYFMLHAPDSAPKLPPEAPLSTQIAAGALDLRLCGLGAEIVDDWQFDEDGELRWVRTHTVENVRDEAFGPPTKELHHWCYYTPENEIEFEASREIGKPWADDQQAKSEAPEPHSFDALPAIRVEIPRGLWVANRLAQIALSLFNREGSLDHNLDVGAYPAPVIKAEDGQLRGEVFSSESMAIVVSPAGDFKYAEPSGASYQALAANCDKKKSDLYSAFGAMYLTAAAQEDQGRASGSQLKRKMAPLEVMCRAFAMPVIDALERAFAIIKRVRKDDDVEIKIEGLDRFDTFAMETEIAKTNSLCSVAGMPKAAQKYAAIDLFKKLYPDAPQELITEIEAEPIEGGVEEVNTDSKSGINPRTDEPNGMGAQSIAQSYTPASPTIVKNS